MKNRTHPQPVRPSGFEGELTLPPLPTPRRGEPSDQDDVAMLALRSFAVHDPTDESLGLIVALEIAKRH